MEAWNEDTSGNRDPDKELLPVCADYPVRSTQRVEITEWVMHSSDQCCQTKDSRVWTIDVDGIRLKRSQIEELAMNDGFESVDQFFAWFNKDWKGKIIHWTDLKY